ncbi:MAG: cell division protein SepF [Clostridia bacterium]|nr:cell division protein SepF [Clostridia bacterium]MBR2734652.1 cell division protein SepF [Clostridia bacterium]
MASLMQKFKEMWAPSDEYYDDEYENQEELEENSSRFTYRDRKNSNDKIVNLRSSSKSKVVLTKPDRFSEDIKNVADELSQRHTIVLNLEDVAKPDSRRIIDFLSGATYSQGGKIRRVSTDTFIITPCNVDIEGSELIGELENHGVYF